MGDRGVVKSRCGAAPWPWTRRARTSSARRDFLEYDGPEFQAAFNPGFVVDALKHIDTEKTQLSMTSPVNPVLFEPAGGDDYRFVVMPMRA